jgi:hypothetical protein
MVLLRSAKAVAATLRPSLPPAGSVQVSLPARDDVARTARVEAQRAALRLVSISERFGLADGFEHQTLAALPADQHYRPAMALPKSLLAMALAIDVTTGAPASPFEASRWLGAPRSAQLDWSADSAFTALRAQGPNPAWLRRAPELAHLVGTDEVYAVDYRALLEGLPTRPGRSLSACAAIFVKSASGLRASGAVIDGLHVPATDPRWARARRYFHCAELHVHEAVSHFLWTHVFGEKLLVATLRHLDVRHPVRRLLEPHFDGTLQANENSGRRLLGVGGFFDTCFSAGWRGVAELLRRGDDAWRFERMVVPRDLESRGVAGLEGYAYAEDALGYWRALERYAGGVIDAWYADDAAVRDDLEVAAWSRELTGWLGSRGFPEVTGRAALTCVVTATLFNVVQHTLVNAQQYDGFGDPARWPAALCAPFESAEEGLPVGAEAVDAVRATYGFSIQYTVLGTSLVDWHPPRTAGLARALLAELDALDRRIEVSDRARPWPWRITRVANVSNSINA